MSSTSAEPAAPDLNRRADLAAHPHLAPVYAAAERGDWPTVAQALYAANSTDRFYLIQQLAEVAGVERWLPGPAQSDPVAAALLAEREVVLAWQVRGAGSTQQTSREQFEGFRTGLVAAERRLTWMIAHHPDDAIAWAIRCSTTRGLELGPSEAKRRWDRFSRLEPDNVWVALARLQYLLPKWFGSWDEAYAFADETAAAAPANSPLKVLPIYVHLERWRDLGGGESGTSYLQQPAVAQSMITAARTTYRPMLGWAKIENTFAMLYAMADAWPYASAHFARVGDLGTEMPWTYLGDAREKFVAWRDRVQRMMAR